jgi:phosphorylcholine metabolism protein LicD
MTVEELTFILSGCDPKAEVHLLSEIGLDYERINTVLSTPMQIKQLLNSDVAVFTEMLTTAMLTKKVVVITSFKEEDLHSKPEFPDKEPVDNTDNDTLMVINPSCDKDCLYKVSGSGEESFHCGKGVIHFSLSQNACLDFSAVKG